MCRQRGTAETELVGGGGSSAARRIRGGAGRTRRVRRSAGGGDAAGLATVGLVEAAALESDADRQEDLLHGAHGAIDGVLCLGE